MCSWPASYVMRRVNAYASWGAAHVTGSWPTAVLVQAGSPTIRKPDSRWRVPCITFMLRCAAKLRRRPQRRKGHRQ